MSNEKLEQGLAIRKQVLGAQHVERSLAAADEFNKPIQELVTEYCWGQVWGNEDLPRQTRSLLNIAMLTALNRSHELKVHVQGALRNGVPKQQIQATLMQTAIYCGVPAALESFRVASEAIKTFTE